MCCDDLNPPYHFALLPIAKPNARRSFLGEFFTASVVLTPYLQVMRIGVALEVLALHCS
jgi:hypothetical protein